MYSLFLAHHGIKGQRWGIRRYQNPDGSLTEAGRKRYTKDLEKAIHKNENKAAAESGFKGKLKYDDNGLPFNKYYETLHPEVSKIHEKIRNDKEYQKAIDEYFDTEDEYTTLYEKNASSEKIDRAVQKHIEATMKLGDTWIKSVNKYEPELLAARLKEIDIEDTSINRELLKDIYTKRRGSNWWRMD